MQRLFYYANFFKQNAQNYPCKLPKKAIKKYLQHKIMPICKKEN